MSTGLVYAASEIDVNTATKSELQIAKGIGEKTADAIIEYRKKNGPFSKIEELINVKGIGEKKLVTLSEQLMVKKAE